MAYSRTPKKDELGYPLLEEGRIVNYEGRVYRVGLVNLSRARLDPVTAGATTSPVSGRSFATYGAPISICSTATLVDADLDALDPVALGRLLRMQREAEAGQSYDRHDNVNNNNQQWGDDDDVDPSDPDNLQGEGYIMANGTPAAAPMPVATKTKAELNKDRIAKLAANKGAAVAKAPGEPKAAKAKAVADKQCKCGCGGLTASYFVPGHDARFKGWVKKIESGKAKKEELMTKEVIAQYKWVKVAGGGERPTTDYKGDKYEPTVVAAAN